MKFIVCALVCFLFSSSTADPSVEVSTKSGPVIGEQLSVDDRPVTRFLGIPYAKPPLGSLRFHRPHSAEAWSTPLLANKWPNQCIQGQNIPLVAHLEHLNMAKNVSEDCLYLNVWTPKVGDAEKRPALVWIHGGGLFFGTSSFDIFDGEMLASKADAVIVTVNYRVSVLGFLYSPEVADIKGNQGFWDQTMALQWVQENIAAFGGNPNQVTLMGESAGGWSVSAHILSPVSRDLYQNAIVQSGAILDFTRPLSAQEHQAKLLTGIRKVGCANVSDSTISPQIIECLQKLEPFQVDQVYHKIDKDPFNPLVMLSVVDGTFLPGTPQEMLASGNYKRNIRLLATTVEDEGSFIISLYGAVNASLKAKDPAPLSLEEAKGFFGSLLGEHLFPNRTIPQEMINMLYYSGLNGSIEASDEHRKRTGIAFGDLFIGCPTLDFAQAIFAGSPETARVYQMHYKAKLGNLKMACNEWAGACHCDDLYPVFGVPFRHPENYTNRERDISTEVIDYLAAFIRNGTPGPNQTEWKPYLLSSHTENVIAPYYEINVNPKRPENFKFNLKQLECSVWRHITN